MFQLLEVATINMPLGKSVSTNFKELYADNKKKGKAKGANGKARGRKQIIAIALSAAGKGKKQSNATMKASRKHTKPPTKPVAKPYNFLAMQKKLGVVR